MRGEHESEREYESLHVSAPEVFEARQSIRAIDRSNVV